MHIDEERQKVLDNLPAEEPRSRLEPFRQFILRWRREGRSYKRIRQILHDECHVKVAHATLFKFVQRRSRARKAQPKSQAEPVVMTEYPTALPAPGPEPSQTTAFIGLRLQRSPEELAAQREAIRAAYNKPVVPQEAPKKRFVYDPDKPPINKNY
jgi:DNA-binding transcriptional MerR regulator